MKKKFWIIVPAALIALTTMNLTLASKEFSMSKTVLSESISEKLAGKTIYFGHQSVGSNILHGIEELKGKYPWLSVSIDKIDNIKKTTDMQVLHSFVGENGKPSSKNDSFKKTIVNDLAGSIDIAVLKYCYVDLNAKSDINKIFNNYKKTVQFINKTYPNVIIIHFTVPLTTNQGGIKAVIKKILGRPVGGAVENVIRNQYNELIKNEYAIKGNIFDLAELESTKIDGGVNQFKYNGKDYKSLVRGYTDDGQHLNKTGRKYIAEHFLLFLADIITR